MAASLLEAAFGHRHGAPGDRRRVARLPYAWVCCGTAAMLVAGTIAGPAT